MLCLLDHPDFIATLSQYSLKYELYSIFFIYIIICFYAIDTQKQLHKEVLGTRDELGTGAHIR